MTALAAANKAGFSQTALLLKNAELRVQTSPKNQPSPAPPAAA